MNIMDKLWAPQMVTQSVKHTHILKTREGERERGKDILCTKPKQRAKEERNKERESAHVQTAGERESSWTWRCGWSGQRSWVMQVGILLLQTFTSRLVERTGSWRLAAQQMQELQCAQRLWWVEQPKNFFNYCEIT